MNSKIAFRQASLGDCDVILDTLVAAFDDDPVWGTWAFPQHDGAERQRRSLFRIWLEGAIEHCCVLASCNFEAVALWYPPSATRDSEHDQRGLAALAASLGADADVFLEGCARLEAAHPQERPHFYLSLLGTRPEARGQRFGARLLEGSIELLDAARMPAYLESTNPKNLPLYESLAFERIGRLQLPGQGPIVDLMWREPK
jgi:GNAT superfamily N-acetyltransferase